MSAPTAYARQKNFTDYAISHPEAPFNASDLDAELNALLITLQGVLANRVLIQRDDGALKNDSVHPDSLSTATLLLIEAAGDAEGLADLVRGLWVTATAYTPGQIVQNLTSSYICAVAHTSSAFDTDKAAGKWIILGETAASGASGISFSPAGNIVAITIQAAIEELDADKAKKEGDSSQVFSVAAATAAAHAPNMGQIQKNTLKTAIATGSGNALLATIESGLTTLTDGMEFVIEAPGSNTLTVPTLNLTLGTTATGAKTIVKGNNLPVIAGDIASNKCVFCYDLSLDKWVLLNPVFSVGVSSSDATAGQPKNLGLAFTVGGNALAATVVTASGSIPTAADQIRVPMPSSNIASGTFNVRTITASIGLTISSGSTLAHLGGAASTIHWYLIDNAGTLELAASGVYQGSSGIVTTVAEGGAGAADSGTVMYSTTARSNVPCLWIAETTDTQTDAGIWLSAPSEIRLIDWRATTFTRTLLDDASAAAARLTLLIEPPIFPLTASVAGNALTFTLNPCAITFRDYVVGSGNVYTDVVSAPISTTISAGSTAGMTSGVSGRIYVFALYYASTIELGWIFQVGGNGLSEYDVIATVAEGGAGGADLSGQPYSNTARSLVPYRLVGWVEVSQVVAGTWATAPTRIVGASPATMSDLYGLGAAQSWQDMSASRAINTTYTNTTGRPIIVTASMTSTTASCNAMIIINGVTTIYGSSVGATGQWMTISAVVPNGVTYRIAVSAGTGTIAANTWRELR
jgi:hypothetical protein